MRTPRARSAMRGTLAALVAAWVTTGGGLTRPRGPGSTHAADQEKAPEAGSVKDELHARWVRLRAEYVKTAESLLGPLERTDPPGADGPNDPQILARKAELAYQDARLAREAAERALAEYTEGTAGRELEVVKAQIAAAEAAVKRAVTWVERLKVVRQQIVAKLDAKGDDLSASEILARFNLDRASETEELALERCKVELEQANARQALLTQYSQRKRQLELRADIEKKRSEELSRQAEWEWAKLQEARAKRLPIGPGMRPDQRKALALLADAVRSPGPRPPWDRDPTEFRAYLDHFEARLAEARSLAERAGEKAEMDRFLRMTARVRRELSTTGGPGGD